MRTKIVRGQTTYYGSKIRRWRGQRLLQLGELEITDGAQLVHVLLLNEGDYQSILKERDALGQEFAFVYEGEGVYCLVATESHNIPIQPVYWAFNLVPATPEQKRNFKNALAGDDLY